MAIYGVVQTTGPANNLLAGDHPPVVMPVTIAAASGELPRGAVLGRLTGSSPSAVLYAPYTPGASNGSEVARAILVDGVNAVSEVNALAFVHGEFNSNALSGLDDAAVLQLWDRGIYIKEVV